MISVGSWTALGNSFSFIPYNCGHRLFKKTVKACANGSCKEGKKRMFYVALLE